MWATSDAMKKTTKDYAYVYGKACIICLGRPLPRCPHQEGWQNNPRSGLPCKKQPSRRGSTSMSRRCCKGTNMPRGSEQFPRGFRRQWTSNPFEGLTFRNPFEGLTFSYACSVHVVGRTFGHPDHRKAGSWHHESAKQSQSFLSEIRAKGCGREGTSRIFQHFRRAKLANLDRIVGPL